MLPRARGYCGRAYVFGGGDGSWYPPLRGPVGHPGCPPWYQDPRNAASGPIRARIDLILAKLSQNRGVSPVFVEKASVSPCFQNGSQKSPLEISRKPFSLAFSHKELMGQNRPGSDFIVKMTKCRPDVHALSREVDGQIPPPVDAASCSCRRSPHLTSARDLPDILNDLGFERFAGDYD